MLDATERRAWTNHWARPQPAVKELLSRMLFVVARPLQALGPVEACVTHAGVHWTELTDFVPHLFRGGMAEAAVHAIGQIANDLDVVMGLGWRRKCAADALHASFAAGHASVGFAPSGGGRENDVGKLSGLRHKHILHYERVETLKKADRSMLIGLRLRGIFANDIERLQFVALHRIEHSA